MDQPRSHPLKITIQQKLHPNWDAWKVPQGYLNYASTLIVFMDRGCDRTIYKYRITKHASFRLVAIKKTNNTVVYCGGDMLDWRYRLKYIPSYKEAINKICSPLFKTAQEINILLEDHLNNKSEMAAQVLYNICCELQCFHRIRSFSIGHTFCASLRHEHGPPTSLSKINTDFMNKLQDCSLKLRLANMNPDIVIQWLKEWQNGQRELEALWFWVPNITDWWSVLSPHLNFEPPMEGFRYGAKCLLTFLHRTDRTCSLWCAFNGFVFQASPCCKRSVI